MKNTKPLTELTVAEFWKEVKVTEVLCQKYLEKAFFRIYIKLNMKL